MKSKILWLPLLVIGLIWSACNNSSAACENCDSKKHTPTETTQAAAAPAEGMQTETKEIIVDVRTVGEWNNDGHADCTVNYPLDQIASHADELKKYDKVVLVCRSGNRANSAKAILENAGVKNITNLGPWQNVKCQ